MTKKIANYDDYFDFFEHHINSMWPEKKPYSIKQLSSQTISILKSYALDTGLLKPAHVRMHLDRFLSELATSEAIVEIDK